MGTRVPVLDLQGRLMSSAYSPRPAAEGFATPSRPAGASDQPTIDAAEIAQFQAIAAEWWDPNGKTRALHKFNPVRVRYICDQVARQFGRDPGRSDCLKGLRVLDIGCGGGLLCEPLARLGASVVGIDPASLTIDVATRHAKDGGLAIDYRCTTAEELADAGERFDVVITMEVIEHVIDVPLFVRRCAEMVKPGGLLLTATINRTFKAFAFVIVGGEYVARWIARGTHQYRKFVTPHELQTAIERAGMTIVETNGANYNILSDSWHLSRNTSVNYLMAASKAK
jgi:2-polyprenyl-6-hydroxyphenyl methylase / 3-demethylubiquinone-9 3-methyltransferase